MKYGIISGKEGIYQQGVDLTRLIVLDKIGRPNFYNISDYYNRNSSNVGNYLLTYRDILKFENVQVDANDVIPNPDATRSVWKYQGVITLPNLLLQEEVGIEKYIPYITFSLETLRNTSFSNECMTKFVPGERRGDRAKIYYWTDKKQSITIPTITIQKSNPNIQWDKA